jgi:phosphatidylethanolamine/phosphatidyl-N-methylethanolamine N-methyltransferase
MRQRSRDVTRSMTASTPARIAARSRAVAAHTSDAMAFLQGFLRQPAQVGSVIPSSAQLERRLVRAARIEGATSVVELGPGTGGTTRALLRAMRPDARLLAVELSPEFHARLTGQISDARLQLQLGSAEHLAEFLAARRLPPPEAILSGIPFSTMPAEVADRIAGGIAQALAPGGRFVAYQVRAHVARYVTPYLGAPQRQWELINVPPVQVFSWTKPVRS